MRSSRSSLVWLKWLIVEDNWCRSSKSPHMCRGPKQVREDQITGGPEKLLALRAEGTIVSRWRSNVGNKTMSKFMRFLGGPNGPKICARGTKFDFEDWGWRIVAIFLKIFLYILFTSQYFSMTYHGSREETEGSVNTLSNSFYTSYSIHTSFQWSITAAG